MCVCLRHAMEPKVLLKPTMRVLETRDLAEIAA